MTGVSINDEPVPSMAMSLTPLFWKGRKKMPIPSSPTFVNLTAKGPPAGSLVNGLRDQLQ